MINSKNTYRISRRSLGLFAAGTALGLAMPPTIGRAQPAALRITSIQPTTGPSSPYGWRARDGAQLVTDDINAAGLSIRGSPYLPYLRTADLGNSPQPGTTPLRPAASNPDYSW